MSSEANEPTVRGDATDVEAADGDATDRELAATA